VIPLSQTILLDAFPKRQQGLVTSIFGMAVVIGPVIGPTPWAACFSELYSWRWAFYMIVPVGLISFIGLRFTLPPTGPPPHRARLDGLPVALGRHRLRAARAVARPAPRLVRVGEILIETFVAVLAFWIFVAHSLTAKRPFLNLGLLRDRNYALGLVLVLIYGMLNFTPMVLLPPLLQQHAGFPDMLIGEIIAARGVGATIGFFLAIFVGRMDPRIGLIGGFACRCLGLWLMALDLNVDAGTLMANSLVQGIAIGVIWVPLTWPPSPPPARPTSPRAPRSTTCCATSARASSSRSASPRWCAPRAPTTAAGRDGESLQRAARCPG
jgi:DHA2 family multidrug resistance protein